MWWIRSDLCGMFSAGFTVVLIMFAQYVVVSIVVLPWYGFSFHVPLYTCFTLLALVSHCRAQFTNPGAIPLERVPGAVPHATTITYDANGKEILPAPPRVCRRCRVLKPYKAHHCSSCGRCIIRMDHHCPWVNNCVAIFNQKYFLLFLLYTTACTIYAGTLLVARFISCTNNLKQCTVSGIPAVLCVLCFIEAIIFGLFCLVMMYDQLSAIFENTPGIDALQNKKGEARGRYASLCEVFGEPLNWRWWFPLTLPSSLESSFRTELEEMDDPEEQEELREMRLQRQYERQALLAQRQAERERNLAASGAAGSSSSPTTNSSSSTSNSRGESIADGHHRQSLQGPIVFPDGMNQRMKDKAAAVLGREQPIATGTTTPKQEADQQESKEPAAKKQQ